MPGPVLMQRSWRGMPSCRAEMAPHPQVKASIRDSFLAQNPGVANGPHADRGHKYTI